MMFIYIQLFANRRTYLMLLIPIIYSLYFIFFTSPVLFNSDHFAWFFTTFAPGSDSEMFYNYPHTANNLFVVVSTCVLYVVYSKVLLRHSRSSSGLTWAQKSFFIQSTLICMANLLASLIYVYMQFFPTPQYFAFIGHCCWQLGHGFPAFVYLFLNRTIQRKVLEMLQIQHWSTTVKQAPLNSSKTPCNNKKINGNEYFF
ncbi:hypothetical protein DICVIV_13466 [Dictyocaulus viviparus]|uniref:7TM GPCR serpentine receptor class x (Srx) domain-containing protein n=1 Tax=Dictyocaulus viviparus TaxID=29172 RepID=A0A0D8XAA7_DICVI|nr:hypothetical protein DICVIV_13466 [Dictyocaulus viviparus]